MEHSFLSNVKHDSCQPIKSAGCQCKLSCSCNAAQEDIFSFNRVRHSLAQNLSWSIVTSSIINHPSSTIPHPPSTIHSSNHHHHITKPYRWFVVRGLVKENAEGWGFPRLMLERMMNARHFHDPSQTHQFQTLVCSTKPLEGLFNNTLRDKHFKPKESIDT